MLYVKKAIEFRFEEIGISDHAPILKDISKNNFTFNIARNLNMSYKSFNKKYLVQIKKAKGKYEKEIRIFSGVETEYFSQFHDYYVKLKEQLDYMNLGIHFFPTKRAVIKNVKTSLDYQDLKDYATNAVEAMNTGLFKIFVHPDVFMLTYKSANPHIEFDEHCKQISHEIIKASIKNNVYLEINANGVRTSINHLREKNWIYPNENFWKIVRTYPEAKVVIGSGAHSTKELYDGAVKMAMKFAENLGINVVDKISL